MTDDPHDEMWDRTRWEQLVWGNPEVQAQPFKGLEPRHTHDAAPFPPLNLRPYTRFQLARRAIRDFGWRVRDAWMVLTGKAWIDE